MITEQSLVPLEIHGTLGQIFRKADEEKLKIPTLKEFSEALVGEYTQYKSRPNNESPITKAMTGYQKSYYPFGYQQSVLLTNTGIFYHREAGTYVVDEPHVEGEWLAMNLEDISQRFLEGDPSIRHLPINDFDLSGRYELKKNGEIKYFSVEKFAANRFLQAMAGKEGAINLGSIGARKSGYPAIWTRYRTLNIEGCIRNGRPIELRPFTESHPLYDPDTKAVQTIVTLSIEDGGYAQMYLKISDNYTYLNHLTSFGIKK
jgi:hypothetical protein